MEALTTPGLGEIRPVSPLLRALVCFESLIGLGIVTTSVSWIVLIYPALARLNAFPDALSSFTMLNTHGNRPEGSGAEPLLDELTLAAIRTRIDFVHFPLICYFSASIRAAPFPPHWCVSTDVPAA